MKICAVILVLASSCFANAKIPSCTENIAYIEGKVSSVRRDRVDQNIFDCYYKIEFLQFKKSEPCPLDISEVRDVELQDPSCTLKVGDPINGVIVKKDGHVFMEE